MSLFTVTFDTSESSDEVKVEASVNQNHLTQERAAINNSIVNSDQTSNSQEKSSEEEASSEEIPFMDAEDPDQSQMTIRQRNTNMVTYRAVRTKIITWKGQRVYVQLYHEGRPVYKAKLASKAKHEIAVCKGTDVHMSSPQMIISFDPDLSAFSLREGSSSEIAHVRFISYDKGRIPRGSILSISNGHPDIPVELDSRKPKQTLDGTWTLDFGTIEALTSVKNRIYVDQNDFELLIVAKSEKNVLGLDSDKRISDKVVLLVAVASFLTKT